MLADVGERLLRDAVHRERGFAVQVVRVARDCQRHRDVRVALDVGGELLQSVGAREVVVAQRRDRAARFLEARAGEVVGAVERVRELPVRARLHGEHPRSPELEHQTGQRGGEDVVHVARQAAPLSERGRFSLGVAARLELEEQPLGLLVRLRGVSGEPGEKVEGGDPQFGPGDHAARTVRVDCHGHERGARAQQQRDRETMRQADRRECRSHE